MKATKIITSILLFAVGFVLSSSLASTVSDSHLWMLAAGLLVSLALPALLASWIRSVRRSRRPTAAALTSGPVALTSVPASRPVAWPSTLGSILVINLCAVVACVLFLPQQTRQTLSTRGDWWARELAGLAGGGEDSTLVRGTSRAVQTLASWIPGQGAKPAAEDPGLARADGSGPADGGSLTEGRAADGPTRGADGTASLMPGEGTRVSFKRKGSAIVVPVTLLGPAGQTRVQMLFDTGATLTTLDHPTLAKLGVQVRSDDPLVESHTAAGRVKRRITVVEGVELGGLVVRGGLAVTACDECASSEVVGLLGLNVSRHFRVTVDHEAGEILLQPKARPVGHLIDIQPFVQMKEARGIWRGPLLTVNLKVHNRSSRTMHRLKVVAEVKSGDRSGRIWGMLASVPPRVEAPLTIEGLMPVQAATFSVKLDQAEW